MNAAQYMARVHDLPCCVCARFAMVQMSPTEAHHVFHGRFSNRKPDDWNTIPLCRGHHMGDFDTTKIAIHRRKGQWAELYGEDHTYLAATQKRILGYVREER